VSHFVVLSHAYHYAHFCIVIFNDTYRKYFKHQAVNHPDLAHGDSPGQKVFEVIDIEEALGDLRSVAKAKSFIFRLINYTYQIADPQIRGDVQKHINGGFIIAHHHSARKDGASGFYEAMLKSEKIVDEIIEKMIHDSNTGHPLFNYSLNTPSGVHVQPKIAMGDSGYSGWLCTFHIANFWRNCITSLDAPAWGDGGQTPHDL
jgi:hypothetical protein